MVRHYFAPGPISARALGVSETAVSARLIATGDIAPPLAARDMCASLGAINLAPITASADQHLRAAALAKEKPRGVVEIRPMAASMTWTQSAFCAIITRHSCTARCRGAAPGRFGRLVGAVPVVTIDEKI